jgi:hypothetical protein
MTDPDPAAVAAFLNTPVEPVSGDAVPLDLPASAIRELMPPPEEPKVRADTPADPTYQSDLTSQSKLLLWSLQLPSIGEVVVEPSEKIMFLKAALNDEPVVFTVKLAMGLVVELQSRSTFETDCVFVALDQDSDKNDPKRLIDNPATYVTRMQYYSAMTQIRRIGDKAFPRFQIESGNSLINNANRLRSEEPTSIGSMNGIRWEAVLVALRIFEAKLKLCADAAANGDFWKPAS